ncbi:MAG TPA: hypothetical protein VH063_10745 [Gaiellaceae bacterium]|jgi:hypothetical protein|nr:hypothetical protein [Gaiellaceae bacterium]
MNPGRNALRGLGLPVLLMAVLISGLGPGTAQGRLAGDRPPPIPDCFKTGSGYGSCQGMVIPGGGTIVKLEVADKKDLFQLTGPAPLQTTKSVACGDAGCVYNHLDWTVGPGATAVHGCKANQSTCEVNVPPGSTQWTVVYVRQNNDSPTLYAIWNSGKSGYVLGGEVLQVPCGLEAKQCKGKPAPAAGILIRASGTSQGAAYTDAKGVYSMKLPEGHYTVTPDAGTRQFRPDKLSVGLSADSKHNDFETCATTDTLSAPLTAGVMQRAGSNAAAAPPPAGTYSNKLNRVSDDCDDAYITFFLTVDATGNLTLRELDEVTKESLPYNWNFAPVPYPTAPGTITLTANAPQGVPGQAFVYLKVTGTASPAFVVEAAIAHIVRGNETHEVVFRGPKHRDTPVVNLTTEGK